MIHSDGGRRGRADAVRTRQTEGIKMRKHRVVAIAVALGVVGVAGGVAYAAVPDSGGVIRACYKAGGLLQEKGALRVSEDGTCRAGELPLNWNHTGPAGLTWRGEWAAGTAYGVRDAVQHNGSSYVAVFASTGSAPPNGNWMLLAGKGESGAVGAVGPKGDQGDQGVQGERGFTGPQGAKGDKGDRGDPGPSDAYIGRSGSPVLDNHVLTTIASVNLPAGVYAVFGKARVANADSDDQPARCALSTGDSTVIRLGARFDDGSEQSVSVQDLLTLPAPGTATLGCATFRGQAFDGKITAIKVGAIHG
jgi:hypothetical protein